MDCLAGCFGQRPLSPKGQVQPLQRPIVRSQPGLGPAHSMVTMRKPLPPPPSRRAEAVSVADFPTVPPRRNILPGGSPSDTETMGDPKSCSSYTWCRWTIPPPSFPSLFLRQCRHKSGKAPRGG